MKKVIVLIAIFGSVFLLTGCTKSATMEVKDYLNRYNSLDEEVLKDMENTIDMEGLSDEDRETYSSIFKKQYTDLRYEITDEKYDGDEAVISVKITVYDYYKTQKDVNYYLANNADKFNDENGVYDVAKFIKYRLEQMKMTTDTVDYTIDFYLIKNGRKWQVSPLSNSDLEKIHGIYNYES